MWASAPECVPSQWRHDGPEALADAVGFGAQPGAAARAAKDFRDAYVWYDKESEVKRTLTFPTAFKNASELAALVRAGGVAGGALDNLKTNKPLIVGLVLKRTAALPLSQLAAFKAGATFVPCDPSWPADRTVGILSEANASVVLADATDTQLEVRPRPLPQVHLCACDLTHAMTLACARRALCWAHRVRARRSCSSTTAAPSSTSC